jgi:hypothetical protein
VVDAATKFIGCVAAPFDFTDNAGMSLQTLGSTN